MEEAGKEELYQKPSVVEVKGKIVPHLERVNLEEEDRFPFLNFLEDKIPVFSVIAVSPEQIGEDEVNKSILKLVKPTIHHGRAHEIRFAPPSESVVWSDEHGILFGSLNIKGNNLEDPRIEHDRYAPDKLRVHGLQDTVCSTRILQASQKLRQLGVEAEKVELVIKPQELIWNGDRISLEEFKSRLLEKVKREIEEGKAEGYLQKQLGKEDLPRIERYLGKAEFVFTVRGHQVTERLRDLREIKSQEEFEEMMRNVFRFVNLRNKLEYERRETKSLKEFDAQNEEDIIEYFTDYLPQRLATNMAKMHNAQIAHNFLSSQNVSLVGSIYDLDGVRGLGIEAVGLREISKDASFFLGEAAGMFWLVRQDRVDISLKRPISSWFKERYGERLGKRFFEKFLDTYLEKSDLSEFLPQLDDIKNDLIEDIARTVANHAEEESKEVDEVLIELKSEGEGLETEISEEFPTEVENEVRQVLRNFLNDRELGDDSLIRRSLRSLSKEALEKVVGEETRKILSQVKPGFYRSFMDDLKVKAKNLTSSPSKSQ